MYVKETSLQWVGLWYSLFSRQISWYQSATKVSIPLVSKFGSNIIRTFNNSCLTQTSFLESDNDSSTWVKRFSVQRNFPTEKSSSFYFHVVGNSLRFANSYFFSCWNTKHLGSKKKIQLENLTSNITTLLTRKRFSTDYVHLCCVADGAAISF